MNMALVLRNARATATANALYACTIRAYSGTMPASGAALDAANMLLAEFAYPAAVGVVDSGILTLTKTTVMALASGTPTFIRATDPTGEWLFDLAIGQGSPVSVTPPQVFAGGEVTLELTLAEP